MFLRTLWSMAFSFAGMMGLMIQVFAGPNVLNVHGTSKPGATLTVMGSGFGTKEPARPYVWADFAKNINPSSLGLKTKWDSIQNLAWSPDDGGTARSTEGREAAWTLRADFKNWTDDGRKIYLYRRTRMNFVITNKSQNWIIWRMWSDMKPPTFDVGSSNGSIGTGGLTPFVNAGFYCNEQNPTIRIPDTKWHTEEIVFQSSSVPGVFDGSIDIRIDGGSKCSGNVMTRDQYNPAFMNNNFVVHMVGSNLDRWIPRWNPTNQGWADDVYADTTWARVMVGNAASYSECTELAPQIPTAWSDTSITVVVNKGPLSDLCKAYLYVFDANGAVDRKGYPLASNCEGVEERGK